ITGTPVEYSIWAQQWFWITVVLMFLIGVFLSGLYPVIVLSSYKPVAVLRGKIGNSAHGINLRKVLVGFQFLMALVMLICTYAVFRQITFMKNQDLGFSMDEKIIIRAPRVRDTTYSGKLSVFKEQLLRNPGIINFCATTDVPGKQSWWDAGGICRVGTEDNKNYQIIGIDYDFVNVFNLKFAAGRNFSKEFPSDSTALILNETAVKWLGFKSPEDAIGQQVLYWGKIFTVAGVLKDYRQQSLKFAFEPHIFRFMPYGRDVRGLYALTINGKETKSVIQDIRTRYDEFFPGNPFEYFFLDEYFNRQYKSDEMFGKVFGIFSILAIFVTSLGILGLSSFMVLQRTKEIGIRKVLGAGIWNILLLFTKDFQWLLLISFIIACPVSYFGVKYWLESFAVRMDISAWLFIIPLLIVSLITSLTICLHVITAALANPVESLRSE
ncbi:MAG: ABC transporter permease, partial [Ignavibacteriae bacterium]|nr:ABC transporter permease [Ignavibacteriota bacterium]